MARSFEDARRWQREGTELLIAAMERLATNSYNEPSCLPGWTRAHVLAHVVGNADALQNLVTWARTGVVTPMYVSSDARQNAITTDSRLAPDLLAARVTSSAVALEWSMLALTDNQWRANVVTAQGRSVLASETSWMRAREVMVHAVDLDNGTTFADLPEDFLLALQGDIKAKRGDVLDVHGAIADVTAWLAGRAHSGVVYADGSDVSALGPWL